MTGSVKTSKILSKKMKLTARDKAVFAYGEACGKLKNQIGRAKRERRSGNSKNHTAILAGKKKNISEV